MGLGRDYNPTRGTSVHQLVKIYPHKHGSLRHGTRPPHTHVYTWPSIENRGWIRKNVLFITDEYNVRLTGISCSHFLLLLPDCFQKVEKSPSSYGCGKPKKRSALVGGSELAYDRRHQQTFNGFNLNTKTKTKKKKKMVTKVTREKRKGENLIRKTVTRQRPDLSLSLISNLINRIKSLFGTRTEYQFLKNSIVW